MKAQILIDNPRSWLVSYARDYCSAYRQKGAEISLIFDHHDITAGDVLILLGCEKILHSSMRALNKNNIVVHESALPQGKGWSPLTWQVIEGKSSIPVTLIEAADSVDSGVIYESTEIHLDGHELVDELRKKQAEATFALVSDFLRKFPNNPSQAQSGESSFYRRRTPEDSALDPNRSIAEQFELCRVADNDRYPLFFTFRSNKYILKIEKARAE